MTTAIVPHWLIYVSGHGFGHWSQVAPVLNHARKLQPGLRLTICTKVPLQQLQARLDGAFAYIPVAADFGMVMASALDVLPAESMAAYQRFHSEWDNHIANEINRIKKISPDLVLSNVAYMPLAAARSAGVPAVAMCSLNWVDIFRHYCGHFAGAAEICGQMLGAYHDSQAFLRMTPSMPMLDMKHLHAIGPVARKGCNRRAEINSALGLGQEDKLVLVSMGGVAMRLPMERWPRITGVRWLVEAAWQVEHPEAVVLESLGMDFVDLLASSDALLCKPGYGSFTEAACNGIPVLYVSRDDWPEEPCLVDWINQNGLGCEVSREMLEAGALEETLRQLLARPKPEAVMPTGIIEAVNFLMRARH